GNSHPASRLYLIAISFSGEPQEVDVILRNSLKRKNAPFNMPTGKPSGFSLIELAIILLIAGIIMTPTLMNYQLYYKERQVSTTTRDIGLVKRALQKYASLYGCYPLPGNPAAASTDVTFGQEAIERIACGALPDARVKALPACKGNDTVMCR